MFDSLSVVQIASGMARHAAARHTVIAENVANADTPGYRARDLHPFTDMVNEGFTLRATRAGHLEAGRIVERAEITGATVAAGPNGNSVSLEEESLRAVEAVGAHGLAMAVYAKAADILRIGIGRG